MFMVRTFSPEDNNALDRIIAARRTIRAFAPEAPPRETIDAVIRAGLQAPYAALAVGDREDFRHFFVFTQGTPAMAEAGRLVQQAIRRLPVEAARVRGREPVPSDPEFDFLQRVKALGDDIHPSLKSAPYFIVLAEFQGLPAAGLQSLAHTLENMWLKAAALGLAFQLLSVIESMSRDQDFVRLLGLPFGEFVLDGCVVGYPAADPPPVRRPDPRVAVKWM
jgi:nitroreductase